MSGDEGTVYDFTLTTKLAKARMYDDFAEIKGPEWPFGHFLFEHQEDGQLRMINGKMWNMPKKGKKVIDHGFKMMQYPHHHGMCDSFGHWNPMAAAYRAENGGDDKVLYEYDLPYELHTETIEDVPYAMNEENAKTYGPYCPFGDCEVVNYAETVVEGSMWAEDWHDYIQGGSMVMHKRHADGSLGEPMACCNIYHYKIKELVGDDPNQKIQLGQDLADEDKLAMVVEREGFEELFAESWQIVIPEDFEEGVEDLPYSWKFDLNQ